ncbi:hypothetical protein BDW62DRAFT_213583 [Aspergillus aurantiobrunneus]
MGTTSVRRNLFQNHLSRRPVSTPGPSNGAPGLSSQISHSTGPEPNPPTNAGPMDDGEILVKDKNGSYKLDIPVLPPIVGEDGEEMGGIEGGHGGSSTAATGANSTGQGEMGGREKEKIEASLVEIYCEESGAMALTLAEILNLLNQSLKNRVAALDEDNWIYEPEADTRV